MLAVTGGSACDLRTSDRLCTTVRSSQASLPPLTALTLDPTLYRRFLF
jgi:hypothetical protein